MENNIKYCSKCGAENNQNAIFCSTCGSKLSEYDTREKENKRVSGFATAGFIMSILAWILDYTTSLYDIDFILGVILCFLGLHYTRRGEQKGRGLAIFGILSFIAVFAFMVLGVAAGTI